jgi:hypothetical protein
LYAWCFRKFTDDPTYTKFSWLLDEMKNVKLSEYSQYYDKERMQAVTDETSRLAREGLVPDDLSEKYRELIARL